MPVEIERKFLVKNDLWKAAPRVHTMEMRQAYLPATDGVTVRVRLTFGNGIQGAILTLKGPRAGAFSRSEFEYAIAVSEALEIMELLCDRVVSKTRYKVRADDGNIWEVDVFDRENKGLVVAEIELDSEDQEFELPSWVGREVTHVSKYSNNSLSRKPYSKWKKKKK